MSKFLLNLLVQISKALVYSKIQFLFEKELSSDFGPSSQPCPCWPALPAGCRVHAQPIQPKQPCHICQKVYFLRLCTFQQRHLHSLTSLPCGPRPSASSPSPCQLISHTSPLLLIAIGHPAPPSLQHRDAHQSLHSPALIPPFNPPLIPSSSHPAFNGVKAITVGRFPLPRPSVPLPGHYKRARSTPGHHHTHPAILCSLPSPQLPPHRALTAAVISLRHSATSPPPEPR
jgi:hypothetical protein